MSDYMTLIALGNLLISAGIFVAIIITVNYFTTERKSKTYRQIITDMYVSAKTKLLAKEDGLDINEEYENFKKWNKKERMNNSTLSLDNAIEEELKQKISEPKKK
jgi:predicted nucleic acid-binding protein